MAEKLPEQYSMDNFSPDTISDMEELYGLRAEELFRGIAPDAANRIYGPRTRIDPTTAAELKVDLAKTYQELAKVSQDGESASASDRVKLAIAAIQAASRTDAASITAEAGVRRTEMTGEYGLALQSLKQADSALSGLGPLTSDDKDAVASISSVLSATNPLMKLPRGDLFSLEAASSNRGRQAGLAAAQANAYENFRQAVQEDNDPDRIARLTVQIAQNNATTAEKVKAFLETKAGANRDDNVNQAVLQAFSGAEGETTSAKEAIASYDRSNQNAYNAIQASKRRRGGTSSEAYLAVGLAALEPGPGGIQLSEETLQSLEVTAEQLQDPNAVVDIQDAARAQFENLFASIDEGASSTPYIQEKVDTIKRSARIEGSAFRELLIEAKLDPDNPAHVDAGFQLLEDEYAEVRMYETREAKMRAETARQLRRQRRMNQRQLAAEGQLDAGAVQAERRPEAMMPVEDELALMEQEALQQQGVAPAGAEAATPGRPKEEVEAELVQQGLLVEGTGIIPLGKLPGDSVNEYAFDSKTNEFIGIPPGKDATAGNRFQPGEELAKSNPTLFKALRDEGMARIAKIQKAHGVPDATSEQAPAEQDIGRSPEQKREGISVRESQTENMQTIEKRLRAAARAARNRGNEESANNLEEEADRYLTLESGVSYREAEAQVGGVGEGFEQDEMEMRPNAEKRQKGREALEKWREEQVKWEREGGKGPEPRDLNEVLKEALGDDLYNQAIADMAAGKVEGWGDFLPPKESLEEVIPEDEPWQTEQTRLRKEPLEPIGDLLRTEEEKAGDMAVAPEEELTEHEKLRSFQGLPAALIPEKKTTENLDSTSELQEDAQRRLKEMERKRREETRAAGAP